jgi:hypothetical protein
MQGPQRDTFAQRMSHRREHLMSEIQLAPAPLPSVRRGAPRAKSALLAAAIGSVALTGVGVAYAGLKSEPNVPKFDSYVGDCDTTWSCLSKATSALGESVIGPKAGTTAGALTVAGSSETDTGLLSYRIGPPAEQGQPGFTLSARRGHDSLISEMDLPTTQAANAISVNVAGQPGRLIRVGQAIKVYVQYGKMHYLFIGHNMSESDMRKAIETLRVVSP